MEREKGEERRPKGARRRFSTLPIIVRSSYCVHLRDELTNCSICHTLLDADGWAGAENRYVASDQPTDRPTASSRVACPRLQ